MSRWDNCTEREERVSITPVWTPGTGCPAGESLAASNVELIKAANFSDNWFESGDGYYYYKVVLDPNMDRPNR